jgi:putative component of membrane protein insertase Oxa1/YidC/SpoIIIJ protein YidD
MTIKKNITILLISFLFTPLLLWCQSESDVAEIIGTLQTEQKISSGENISQDHSYRNEYNLLLSGAFYFYKSFISSQDASHCSFTPSCSEYAVLAIQKQGIFAGLLNFFDRFSRCNSLSPELYKKDPHTHLLIDPVRDIHYEKIP